MRVQVTADDIRDGKVAKCSLCPVALAIQRTTGNPDWRVGSFWAWVNPTRMVWLPNVAAFFIAKFDRYQPVEPFDFELAWEFPTSEVGA